MKIQLVRAKVYRIGNDIYRNGETVEVDIVKGKTLLSRTDSSGIPFFIRVDEQPIIEPEQQVTEEPKRRGRRRSGSPD